MYSGGITSRRTICLLYKRQKQDLEMSFGRLLIPDMSKKVGLLFVCRCALTLLSRRAL